jgi:hypothetical protein
MRIAKELALPPKQNPPFEPLEGRPKIQEMKRIIFLLLFVQVGFIYGQKKQALSGYLTDAASGEALIGANVVAEGTGLGDSTNAYGFYSLALPAGEYTVRFYY